jgi:protein-S-isoprenylcysteine O-methyltransferase Ste14
VKLAGLWATWGAIAVFYCVARWYWNGSYGFSMKVLGTVAPWLFGLSIPYILWIDRYLVEPRDGAFAFGQWIVGGAAGAADRQAIAHHARAWLVKGFFLAFMLSIVPGNFADFLGWKGDPLANPVDLANCLIAAMFLIDVAFATVGYVLTMRPLDAHIRTANPTMQGWVAALICYPPFALMVNGGPLDYHNATAEWSFWLDGHVYAQWAWCAALVGLTGIYAWATMAFGPRFSNLTHRGILTHGPYAWSKHPAYLSKNLFWWLSSLPFLATSGNMVDMVRNTTILAAVSGVYYWRARTEEKHLSNDPNDLAYREYAAWMERNGPVPRLIAAITGRRGSAELQPAE